MEERCRSMDASIDANLGSAGAGLPANMAARRIQSIRAAPLNTSALFGLR
jgi:hypothetical protein